MFYIKIKVMFEVMIWKIKEYVNNIELSPAGFKAVNKQFNSTKCDGAY